MGNETVKLPKYGCTTCLRCQNEYCVLYKRKVENYNRCFNHTKYHTNPIPMADKTTLEYLVRKAQAAQKF